MKTLKEKDNLISFEIDEFTNVIYDSKDEKFEFIQQNKNRVIISIENIKKSILFVEAYIFVMENPLQEINDQTIKSFEDKIVKMGDEKQVDALKAYVKKLKELKF